MSAAIAFWVGVLVGFNVSLVVGAALVVVVGRAMRRQLAGAELLKVAAARAAARPGAA
jgi:hypothetical protein